MSGSKMVSGNGVARWSVVGAAVLVALSLSACGGGSSSGSSGGSQDLVYTLTPTTGSVTTEVGSGTTQNSGSTSASTDIGFEVVVLNADGTSDTTAAVAMAGRNPSDSDKYSSFTDSCSDSRCLLTLPFSNISESGKFLITVSAPGKKPAVVQVDASGMVAGSIYKIPASVTLTANTSLSLPVETLKPSSVYLGDGTIPDKTYNKFSYSVPFDTRYVVKLGDLPSGVEGNYSYLNVTLWIRGLDSANCKGNRISVFQSNDPKGVRANELVYVINYPYNATSTDAKEFNLPINRAKSFKASSGTLFAEISVDDIKCNDNVQLDDIEFSAVSAAFAN